MQAQVLEHPQWRSQHFPAQSVYPAGSQKHLTSRSHARVGVQLSNAYCSPCSPSFLIPHTFLIPHVSWKFFLSHFNLTIAGRAKEVPKLPQIPQRCISFSLELNIQRKLTASPSPDQISRLFFLNTLCYL